MKNSLKWFLFTRITTDCFHNNDNVTCKLMNVSAETVTANGVMGAMEK